MEKEKLDQRRHGQLKRAIFHGQRKMIESLLDKNAPVNNRHNMQREFRSPLHSSVYLGDPEIVKKLLDRGALVNVLNENDETALMLAAKFEKYDIVDILLSDKRLKNCANRENFTHLHVACMRNRVDVVEKLLEHKADVNTAVKSKAIRWSGFTPLHFAVEFKSIETVAFLLKAGADITIQDSKKLTALHLADMKRNVEMIDMILAAHKRVTKNPANSERLSHFHIACTRNNREVVECFIKNGVVLDEEVDEEARNWAQYSSLDFAIYYDCIDVVELLLEESNCEMFPLKRDIGRPYDRVMNAYHTGNVELANLVLFRDKLVKIDATRIERPRPLHFSCMYENVDYVKVLLARMPDWLNTPMWQGNTPLHLAVERKEELIFKYLLRQGADISIRNADGKSPLHLAFDRNTKKTVKLFLSDSDRMKENIADNDEFSHLHMACIQDNARVVARFVKIGADVNAAVNLDSVFWPGFTPLHFAAKFGSFKVASYLLDQGASYYAIDKKGLSAFDVAILGFQEINQDNSKELQIVMRLILLIHLKHKIESFDDRGFSLLHLLHNDPLNDTRDMKEFIQEHEADVNKAINFPGSPWDGYTPLHFAILNGEKEYANLLIEFGADIASVSANGDYPYHLAMRRYRYAEVPMIALNFDPIQHNPVGSDGYSLFHVACAAGHIELMKYYLDLGVDPNVGISSHGHEFRDETPLHLAAISYKGSKVKVIKLLLEHGADAKLKDDHLNTPLHNMSCGVESEVIDVLISHDVDVNSRNVLLETPLLTFCIEHYWSSDQEISGKLRKFLDHGADINLTDEVGRTSLTVNTWKNNYRQLPLSTEILLKHVMKLQAMGLYVSEDNEAEAHSLSENAAANSGFNFSDFPDKCSKELEATKGINSNASSSLYDILFKDLNRLAAVSENDELQRVVDSDDFEERYPIYGPMLKLQLRKGKERRQLMKSAEKSFKNLLNISVPQECLESILKYLSNADLKNMTKSYDQS